MFGSRSGKRDGVKPEELIKLVHLKTEEIPEDGILFVNVKTQLSRSTLEMFRSHLLSLPQLNEKNCKVVVTAGMDVDYKVVANEG